MTKRQANRQKYRQTETDKDGKTHSHTDILEGDRNLREQGNRRTVMRKENIGMVEIGLQVDRENDRQVHI